MTQASEKRRVLIVTGMSGAGRTATVKALEDLGYDAVDNLPLNFIVPLLRSAASAEGGGPARPMVLAVDIRTRDFDENSFARTADLLASDQNLNVQVIFLDCENEILLRRFAETRRRHPLAEDRPVHDGIKRERDLLVPLRRRADLLVDTSNLSARELKIYSPVILLWPPRSAWQFRYCPFLTGKACPDKPILFLTSDS